MSKFLQIFNRTTYEAIIRYTVPIGAGLGSVSVPTLLLQSVNDPFVTVSSIVFGSFTGFVAGATAGLVWPLSIPIGSYAVYRFYQK